MRKRLEGWKISWLTMASCICMAVLLLSGCGAADSDADAESANVESVTGRVLFISSYSYSWDTVRMQMEGIEEGLGSDVTLDFEYMDTKRVDDETSEELFYESLKYRLSKVEPYDAVIVGDDAALTFALKYRADLFDGVPLVFEGVNDESLALEAAEQPQVTGVIEKLSVADTINLGLALNSKATKVVAILDDSVTGQAERENFYAAQDSFPDLTFTEINCSELTTVAIEKNLKYLSRYSILIYVTMTEDKDGKIYSSSETLEVLDQYSSVPVYRMVEAGIGEGILGGNVVSMTESGRIAAELAVRALQGEDIGEIDVLNSPNINCVDYEEMEEWGLDFDALPEGTTIYNPKESFWVRNREALIPGFILILIMAGAMGWVFFDNYRRRKLMTELEEARSIMESASKHDFLTGLPNRSKFMEDLEYLINHHQACQVIMMDIDDFKKINDNYGHSAGDDALRELGARLKEITSPILSAYRYAGDEFILILQSNQENLVKDTAYQCRCLFTKDFTLQSEKHKICGSMGIACYPQDSDNLEQLIICADAAMYQVKKNGKNDFAFYSDRVKNQNA